MKVSYNVEMDVNELNASFNALKDLLNFIATQQRQNEIERKVADLEDRFRAEKVSKWWKEDSKQPKDSCE